VRILLGAALIVSAVAPAAAQPLVRVVGSVQWVTSTTMQVMSDTGYSFVVDLKQADQATYRGLRTGDWVLVDGVLSPDRRRVVAHEVWRDTGRGSWSQSP
jgi:aspartate-semialdehyde dehydrogenase